MLVLLLSPLSQALDRHDRFTPHDTELNLSVLAVVASAGFWAFGTLLALRRTPSALAWAPPLRRHLTIPNLEPPAPPPSPPPPLRL